MSNRLANETSPYLLQHAGNPVDWYPWGADALRRAREEDKPILLSVGYAACHWCHVMEHESFEDDATARLMNEKFVNIKVDREERPDIDGIYMQAVQAMTGHGGWPMTVFLTPEGLPFYAGTYFPPDDRLGMPSFKRVLTAVGDAFENRRAEVERTTAQLRAFFASTSHPTRRTGTLTPNLLERVYRALEHDYDARYGGFVGAPKFPQVMALDVALRHWARTRTPMALTIARDSFHAMSRGGIYDQLGGGFARYAVDEAWQVPHFEKMLYDNALLARLGTHLWQATKDAEIKRVVEETLDWALREMAGPQGGFYSSLDADSEGHEGKFYVWSASEIETVLGGEAPLAAEYWGVTATGNFEGKNILHVPNEPAVVAARRGISLGELRARIAAAAHALLATRAKRAWPGCDDKILASWNGLMVRALAEAARAFDRISYRAEAIRHGEFLFRALVADGRVARAVKHGNAKIAGFLEDYASLGLAALALYELTFDDVWLTRARSLADATVQWFWDDTTGAFFDTASDHEPLVTRPRDVTDNATPSGTSLATELLARLADLLQDEALRLRATYILETLAEPMARHPAAFGHALGVADLLVRGAIELAIVGDPASDDFRALNRAAAERYVPSLVLAGGPARRTASIALLADRPTTAGHATAYVCRNYTCDAPVTDAAGLGAQLDAMAAAQ
ncbi:MAG TPA: thioredoxin domain-containing protein [Gemmatimonadaceae bacterium]|nr:thioredoxin domain-containing protein [Gemmatimonadaceae bacterium]